MKNTSIFAAFERMWQHIIAAFATKTEVNNLVANKADVSHTHTASDIEGMPSVAYGTEDLEAGVSELETGKIYFVYE